MERAEIKRNLKRRMKVVCTHPKVKLDLTHGKAYEVIDQKPFQMNGQMYQIIDDKGTLAWYGREVVMPLEEWRDLQLSEILREL